MTIEEICAQIIERGDFSGSYDDLVKYVRVFFGEMSHQLSDGSSDAAGYFSVHPVSADAGIPSRTRALLNRLARTPSIVIKVQQTDWGYIERFADMGTASVNERVTPGGLFTVAGKKIKVEGDNADCGVWFVLMVDTSLRYKVTSPLTENSLNRVCGIVPIIPAGKYSVEIVTQYTEDGVLLKEPRTIKGGFPLRNYKILSIKDEEE